MLQQLTNMRRQLRERAFEAPNPQAATAEADFFPNFCTTEIVVNVVVLAQFLAIIFTIVTPPITTSIFHDLVLISLFLQWIAVMSISALCVVGPHLNRLPEQRALLAAYAMLLCITLLVSEFSLWLLATFGYISSARPTWYWYFHAQNITVSAIINALVLRYFVARHQLHLKTLANERARAEILKQRIRPHFLFNSMNIIASLTQRAPARAEAALEDMADLFRLMLDDSKDLAPVQSEVKIARKYLKLEKLRLEKRLNANWSIHGTTRQAKTPVLMLQLLLENAIHFGIEHLAEGGDIDISLLVENEEMKVSVCSPIPEAKWDKDRERDANLDNIKLRLKDIYGDAASIVTRHDRQQFCVEINHPAFGGLANENPGR